MLIPGGVFVVTGGASGLGEGTVRALAAKGANVVILDRDVDKAQAIVAELGPTVFFVEMDALEEDSIAEAVKAAGEKWGKINGCICCAGTGMGMSVLKRNGEPHDMDTFEFIIRLNLMGVFSVNAKCASWMAKNEPDVENERGIIINVASVAAQDGQNGQAAYSASKAGVVGMALPMARDLGRHGIRVNTIMPGVFSTPLTAGFNTKQGARVGDSLRKSQIFPQHRFGLPSDFAQACEFIIESPMMNAESIRLDAGIRMPKL